MELQYIQRTYFTLCWTCVNDEIITSLCVCLVPFKLQEGEVRIISLSQCQSYFDMKTITPRMLCAGYDAGTVDSCMVTSALTALDHQGKTVNRAKSRIGKKITIDSHLIESSFLCLTSL